MKRTLAEGAEIIWQVTDDWIANGKGKSLETVTANAAAALSSDQTFNLACYLKYNGSALTGMKDADWMWEARAIEKIFKMRLTRRGKKA